MTESAPVGTDRVARAIAHLDLSVGRGLEVGPLANPLIRKPDADVYYVDVKSGEALREHYAHDTGVVTEDIVDVDFVLFHDGRTRSLAEVVGPAGPFQWAMAAHVIEHVPDLIAFLVDIAAILEDRGRLALVVPDRRYCFDALRPATTVGEMLLAHDNGDSRPSVRAVFDHFHSAVVYDAGALWRGVSADPADRIHPLSDAWNLAEMRRNTDEYLDSHTWLFTPRSFVDQLETLARLGLHDFVVVGVTPTAVNDFEFFVTLERLPSGLSAEERDAAISTGFPPVTEVTVPSEVAGPGLVTMAVSRREQRLVEVKRAVSGRAHALAHQLKGRLH